MPISRSSLEVDESYQRTPIEQAVQDFYCEFFERDSFWKHTRLEKIVSFELATLMHKGAPATNSRGNNRKGKVTINPSCNSIKRRLEHGNENAGLLGAVINISRTVAHELTHQEDRTHSRGFYKRSEEVAYKLIPSIMRFFPKYCKSQNLEFESEPKI